ncbi:Lrp/AsnC family transcriptional regulator [Thermopetrobacter sp. TC1]|uniref:Lrp/AsnC family transcriptional regulator n=1 Tax=Thermopetrobacter sp. TC1 TaxID=1495045 RepID=UPI00056DEB71|nr:Lrp/AsnC family transcriptional regulator [Thermopetrobacter sp. TC1]
MKLDATDRLLLRLLEQDASRSQKELAHIAGISREAVRRRIARLKRDGIIRRFTVDVALPKDVEKGKIGTQMLTALFLLRFRHVDCARMAAFVRDWPELLAAWTVSGEHDFALLVEAANMDELMRLHGKLERHPSVAGITTLHLTRTWLRRF